MAALRRAVKKHVEQVRKLFQSEKATSNIEIDIIRMFFLDALASLKTMFKIK